MENYELAELAIAQDDYRQSVTFSRAKLTIVSEHGTRLWYVDIDGIPDERLLRRFAESEEIGVSVSIVTIGGKLLSGRGFFHPNPLRHAAAIRGDGELYGYGHPAD